MLVGALAAQNMEEHPARRRRGVPARAATATQSSRVQVTIGQEPAFLAAQRPVSLTVWDRVQQRVPHELAAVRLGRQLQHRVQRHVEIGALLGRAVREVGQEHA